MAKKIIEELGEEMPQEGVTELMAEQEEAQKKEETKKITGWTYDLHGGSVLFETRGFGEKEKLIVEVDGVKAEIENYGNLAIYSKGARFNDYPSVKHDF